MVKVQCTICKKWFSPEDIGEINLKEKRALCKGCLMKIDTWQEVLNHEKWIHKWNERSLRFAIVLFTIALVVSLGIIISWFLPPAVVRP